MAEQKAVAAQNATQWVLYWAEVERQRLASLERQRAREVPEPEQERVRGWLERFGAWVSEKVGS